MLVADHGYCNRYCLIFHLHYFHWVQIHPLPLSRSFVHYPPFSTLLLFGKAVPEINLKLG